MRRITIWIWMLLLGASSPLLAHLAWPGGGVATRNGSSDHITGQQTGATRAWTMKELRPLLEKLPAGNATRGSEVFEKAACGHCHAFGRDWDGNGLAPDLTGATAAYTRDFILESIVDPSATINGRFFHTSFRLKNGTVVRGSLIDVVEGDLIIAPVMLTPDATVKVPKADVVSEEPATISPMPTGLLDSFTPQDVAALLAYLETGGK